jgi:MFS family permease
VPRKPVYLFLSIGILLGTVACGLATNFLLLLAARSVTGGFSGDHAREPVARGPHSPRGLMASVFHRAAANAIIVTCAAVPPAL